MSVGFVPFLTLGFGHGIWNLGLGLKIMYFFAKNIRKFAQHHENIQFYWWVGCVLPYLEIDLAICGYFCGKIHDYGLLCQ